MWQEDLARNAGCGIRSFSAMFFKKRLVELTD